MSEHCQKLSPRVTFRFTSISNAFQLQHLSPVNRGSLRLWLWPEWIDCGWIKLWINQSSLSGGYMRIAILFTKTHSVYVIAIWRQTTRVVLSTWTPSLLMSCLFGVFYRIYDLIFSPNGSYILIAVGNLILVTIHLQTKQIYVKEGSGPDFHSLFSNGQSCIDLFEKTRSCCHLHVIMRSNGSNG